MHVQGKLNEEFLLFWQSTKAHCIFWYGCVIQLVIILFNIGFFVAATFKVIPWFCTAHLLLRITRWPP